MSKKNNNHPDNNNKKKECTCFTKKENWLERKGNNKYEANLGTCSGRRRRGGDGEEKLC